MNMQHSRWRTGADRLQIAWRGFELHCLAPAVGRKVTPSFVKIVRAHGMCSTVNLNDQNRLLGYFSTKSFDARGGGPVHRGAGGSRAPAARPSLPSAAAKLHEPDFALLAIHCTH